MTTQTIINKLTNLGYKVTKSIGTGNIIVTNNSGFSKSFDSYAQAYKHYFNVK